MLHGMTMLTSSAGGRDRGRQVAIKEMKEYTSIMQEALHSGRVYLDVGDESYGIENALTCLVLPKQWNKFMNKVFDSYNKVYAIITCSDRRANFPTE